MWRFSTAQPLDLVLLAFGRQVITGGHGKAVRENVGEPDDDDYFCGKLRADHPGDYGKGCHRPVYPAVYPVAQVAVSRPGGEPLLDRFAGMLVFCHNGCE